MGDQLKCSPVTILQIKLSLLGQCHVTNKPWYLEMLISWWMHVLIDNLSEYLSSLLRSNEVKNK
jgi:hypothetical protein